MLEDWKSGGFGLYIHWPFCAAKCPYCDFNSHVSRSIDHDAWRMAFVAEIERIAQETKGRVLHSVFFGGGTPSLMEPATVNAVMEAVHQAWPVANDLEVTLEANPTSVEASKFADFHVAGVNRISMGIQALDDGDLVALGRLHTVNEALSAFDIARKQFDRVSFDLMYGRQNQSLLRWEAELTRALSLGLDHLSLYQLTIEGSTAFGDRYKAGKLSGLPNEDLSADMYNTTQDICNSFGLPRYEVSNHSSTGNESRHNLIYWRYGDYAGIGPGAHGRLTVDGSRFATEQTRMPASWLKKQEKEQREALTQTDQGTEFLLMGLRLVEGINLTRLNQLSSQQLNSAKVSRLQDLGMIKLYNGNISVTNQGFIILNAVLRELIAP